MTQTETFASESKVPTGSATTYLTSYTYDRQGNTVTLVYPDSATVKYSYNTAGQLEKIERKQSGGSYTDVVSNFDYSPTGQPTTINYANSVTTTNTYDASHLYRLSNKATVNTVPTNLQAVAYTYDADGNITALVDSSATDSAKTAAYVYDDLNRLTSATITAVPSGMTTYTHSFTYNAIGDILTGPAGSYTYGGSSGTNYANPNAFTSLAGVTYTYDNDGNLLQLSSGPTTAWDYNWNYKDQAVYIGYGTAASNESYDQSGNRVSYLRGGLTTEYPNKYYSFDGTVKTKDIYAGDMLVATVTTSGSTVTPEYVHTDPTLGSNVITNSSGTQVQLLDYFPFGDARANQKTTSFDEQKQFGGHYFDTDLGLNYFGARYYDPSFSRFVSEDPSFLAIGDDKQVKDDTGHDLTTYLSNPQSLNSYSYAEENPITKIDLNGKQAVPLILTSPEWAPVVYAGLVASVASLSYGVNNVLQKSGWGQGNPPTLVSNPEKFGLGTPPMGPEDMIPNLKPDLPKWAKVIVGSLIIGSLAQDVSEKYTAIQEEFNPENGKDKTIQNTQSNLTLSKSTEKLEKISAPQRFWQQAPKQN